MFRLMANSVFSPVVMCCFSLESILAALLLAGKRLVTFGLTSPPAPPPHGEGSSIAQVQVSADCPICPLILALCHPRPPYHPASSPLLVWGRGAGGIGRLRQAGEA